MACHCNDNNKDIDNTKKKILLMGNPNVGKSVVFSKLTNVHVDSSNYVGTTVDYTGGDVLSKGRQGVLIDVPGIYSLKATSEAEEVAVGLLNEGADVIVCVLDATHLDRNLDLAYKLKEYNIPIIFSLNLLDVAERQGINIDIEKLEEDLQAPVIPTIAIKNKGLNEILEMAMASEEIETNVFEEISDDERWEKAAKTARKVETRVEKRSYFYRKTGGVDYQALAWDTDSYIGISHIFGSCSRWR